MKKLISTMLTCSLLAVGAASAAYAQEDVMLTAAAPYQVTIQDTKLDLGQNTVYTEGKHLMLPLRRVAESLGFTVTWDAQNAEVDLDNTVVKTAVTIGRDSYYMASSQMIGMSAPTPLGQAPVLKDGITYVPAEMFNILYCDDAYTVKDNVITFKEYDKGDKKGENTQIPNPLVEYKTLEDAKKVLSFTTAVPQKLPEGYSLQYIGTIAAETLDLAYEKDGSEIRYRMAQGKDDISGDYNVYTDVKTQKIADWDVTVRKAEKTISAVWTDGTFTYSLYADGGLTDAELTQLIASIA